MPVHQWTPPCLEHVPERWALYDQVPSAQMAVAPAAFAAACESIGFGLAVGLGVGTAVVGVVVGVVAGVAVAAAVADGVGIDSP